MTTSTPIATSTPPEPMTPHPRVYAGGGVIPFGGAQQLNSPPPGPLNSVIVAMAPNPAAGGSQGYWVAGADGGVFSYGNAGFYGSLGAETINGPIVGMAATPDGKGYWLVASDGGIFVFGHAPFYGSMGGQPLNASMVGMAVAPGGAGYLLVGWDGGIFGFGNAPYYGSLGAGYGGDPSDVPPVTGIAYSPNGQGYWLLEPDGWSYGFTNPPNPVASPTTSTILAMANSQVRSDPNSGDFCNPYGPCEESCALFATWVWQQAGVPIPSYAFTGDIYYWAASHTAVRAPNVGGLPSDAVLYGTGPQTPETSYHVGLVMQRWPDGAIVTIDGDAGPAPTGSLAVVVDGPYLPSPSNDYAGIYAFARP